jgi:hypothetical protein
MILVVWRTLCHQSERRHRNTWRSVFRLNHSRATQGDARWRCLLVAERGMEAHHRLFLLRGEHAVLQPRPQVVDPPQPAALPVPVEPCRRPEPENFENQCTFLCRTKEEYACMTQHTQRKKKERAELCLVQKRDVQSELVARGIQMTLFFPHTNHHRLSS